tara:strand:- start:3489 stop:4772 length:1284 start_codon:yes stop_codon:yes gene_type:complete
MKKIILKNSKKYFKKALQAIPLASQTFSKSHIFFDPEFFPLFCSSGKNQYISDIDGNNYLDLISALGSVSIGYGIKDIDKNIIKSLKLGVTFSLSHKKELELAKTLINIIPCAEMVRFGKNGTDANSAAIRLARYYTGKDHVAVCGYHGWQDWYISSTSMSGGIPKGVAQYTHSFTFNDIKSLEKIFQEKKLAAVMLEPLASELPKNNFLKKVKALCKKNNAILIFDEICTGFRVNLGGAQKLYKIKPDLATFGKAMANGYPLSAIVGSKKIMKLMDKIFFSGTFTGESLSIEACKQTILFLQKNKSIEKNIKKGIFLQKEISEIIKKYQLNKYVELSGHPTWLFLKIKNLNLKQSMTIKIFIMHQLILNEILFLGTFNINASHNFKDLKKIAKVLNLAFCTISKNIDTLDKLTNVKIPKPLFTVRK